MKIHFLQHIPYEGLAAIRPWLDSNNHQVSVTRFFNNESPADPDEVDGLIIMGGPMGVYDEETYPWLRTEKQFIRNVVSQRKPVLGICLGSQLIAEVLGTSVYKADYTEIGWFPVVFTDAIRFSTKLDFLPERLMVYHWHGDTYDLPDGSTRIGSSEGCLNQGFLYRDSVIGLQFHMEMTPESVQAIIEHGQNEVTEGKYIQSPQEMRQKYSVFQHMNQFMEMILEYLFVSR